MELMVSQVKAGDFVEGFGVVTEVRKFYRDRAVKTKTSGPLNRKRVTRDDNREYARLVAKQEEESYDSVLDNVVLKVSGGFSKTYSADKMVKVVRLVKEAA